MQPLHVEFPNSQVARPANPGTALRPVRRGAPMVTPFARALALLGAFTPQDRWLANRDIAQRTGLPASTMTRIAQSLVLLGHLSYDAAGHRYRLAAPVLALGYGAIANSDLQRAARPRMQAFADHHQVHVGSSVRDRLDMIVLDACRSAQLPWLQSPQVGARGGIVSSAAGWALLATLPEAERFYLLEHIERKAPRDWPCLRRRCAEGIAQVQQRGFCVAIGKREHDPVVVAAALRIEAQAPWVLSCIGSGSRMTRAHVERELGVRLLALADEIRHAVHLQIAP